MTNIVKRLRSWCTDWNGAKMVRGESPRDGLHCDDLFDAADEIERLRHALGEIRIFAAGSGDRRVLVDRIYEIATRALRGAGVVGDACND